ncbi:hypothetical protein [Martelella mangrovi]|uniref:PAS domain-containing protein n=1 Tax=Martelella mangrovi TaxID=1397477 RepID=A0ABV2IDY5_9HYPH
MSAGEDLIRTIIAQRYRSTLEDAWTKALGSAPRSDATISLPTLEQYFTDAAAKMLERSICIRISPHTDLISHLPIVEKSYLRRDLDGSLPYSFKGVAIHKDDRIPENIITIFAGNKLLKCAPLTPEATEVASRFAGLMILNDMVVKDGCDD